MSTAPPPPSWRPVVAYAALGATNQMLWLTFTPITTDSARHYGVSSGAVGWFAEIFPLFYVVLAVPTGRLIDRSMPSWLTVGAGLTAAGAVLRLVGDEYAVVLAGQVLVAVAQPFVLNAVTVVSGAYLPASERPRGIAVSSAGIFGGMVLALVLGTAFGTGHLAVLLLVQAALGVAAALWLVAEMRTPGRHVAVRTTPVRLGTVWADRGIRLLVGLVCAGFGVFIALTTWLQALLEPAGVSEAQAGTLLLTMVVAGVAGSAILPPMLARRGQELGFVLASVVLGVAALALLAVAPGFWTGLVASLVVGLMLLTDLPLILELAESRAGSSGGTASALIWLAGNGAGLVAALLVQGLLHRPAIAFAVLGLLLLGGLPLLAAFRRQPAHPDRLLV